MIWCPSCLTDSIKLVQVEIWGLNAVLKCQKCGFTATSEWYQANVEQPKQQPSLFEEQK